VIAELVRGFVHALIYAVLTAIGLTMGALWLTCPIKPARGVDLSDVSDGAA
jgi:hypothetical protein